MILFSLCLAIAIYLGWWALSRWPIASTTLVVDWGQQFKVGTELELVRTGEVIRIIGYDGHFPITIDVTDSHVRSALMDNDELVIL